ncbi:MAG: extracellular solute-binding protein [Ruminococcus sp.]|nr:extracellular solute-binding protein [Ruminococcus sp.]
MIKKFLCYFISFILFFFFLNTDSVSADNSEPYYFIEPESTDISYSDYYNLYSKEKRPETEIIIKGTDYISAENGVFSKGSYGSSDNIKDNVLIWESSSGEVTYRTDVLEAGIYCLDVNYFPIESSSRQIELDMKIDGITPYDTASRIILNRVWINETDIYTDSRGNQVRPSQIQKGKWIDCTIGDPDGLFSEPLFFYLEQGSHEISFSSECANIAIESFKFYNPEKIKTYEEYKNSVVSEITIEETPSNIFRIEGENACYKSDSVLSPTYDNSSYLASPADPIKVVYNTIGGNSSWDKALQSLEWVISDDDVGSGGWFKIGIKSRQNQIRGFYSNRRIYIDGEVVCQELNQVKFFYDNDWNITTPATENSEDIYIYLEGGKNHTLKFECIAGEISEYLRQLDDTVKDLNEYYRKILMITGPYPDKYTDYYVHEKIPELIGEFERISQELKNIKSEIESVSGSSGSEASILESMAVILDKCIEKPLKIPDYLSQIKNCTASVSAWLRDCRDQPLEIDYIEFASHDKKFTECNENFFKSFSFGFRSFIGSFFEDYTTLSDVKNENALDVWVAIGRDQAQIVKELTENDFMQKYDIPVSVNLVSGGVVEAALVGKEPDVVLFLGGEFPVNLASRGLLADISQFEDFNEISERFQKNALTHYQYNNKTYGLPISQSFPMMFYREDILTELGYNSPPETWENLIDMLPAIQRNYMSVGLVLPSANISPATESGHTFAMMMLQKNMSYYNDNLTASSFDSVEAVQTFEQWTDFYTKYSFPQSYDAFSRFRTGEYPIIIADYTFANQLYAVAPEINGLWNFCQVAGTAGADGVISHAVNSTGTGAVIFETAENKENAWEFIKWFTQTDIQVRYANQIEGMLGIIDRFDTANIDALGQLSWTESELERLREQQEQLVEIPVVPASYAVTRNIMNAFREVVNEGENPRDTLIWYNRDINYEIRRKSKT